MLMKYIFSIQNNLTNEQIGELVRLMNEYQFNGNITTTEETDKLVKYLFENVAIKKIDIRNNDKKRKQEYYKRKKEGWLWA